MLAASMMPCNMVTCWNSTYDMLAHALKYRQAVDLIMQQCDLRKYELSDNEWQVIQQLHDVLKVHAFHCIISLTSTFIRRSSKTPHSTLPGQPPTSPLSFRPWIISTPNLHNIPTTGNILHLFMLAFVWRNKHSTTTIV